MCVIATCSEGVPRASPVEFFPLGTTIYVLTEGGKKIENIKKNPRVSIGIHAPFTEWKKIRGLQITGTAELGRKNSKIFEEGTQAYRKRRGSPSAVLPETINVVRVVPQEMEYVDVSLGEKGFAVRQYLVIQETTSK